jgi:PKD domain
MTAFNRCTSVFGRLARRRHGRLALVALGALLLLVGVAAAGPTGDFLTSSGNTGGLAKAGPVSPDIGFPDWYRDNKGVELEPCMTNLDPNCGGAVPVPDPTQPTVFPTNFPDEFFYQDATAEMTTGSGSRVLAQFALEGAFATAVTPGDQMVFSRIRFRIDTGLQGNGQYKITHPYGVDVVQAGPDPANKPNLFITQDVGATAGAFSEVLGGRVGPFLKWAPTADPADVPPAGYIGDGATPHTVTGSDLGTNFVRIEGPGIGGASNPNPCNTSGPNAYTGPAADCIETNLFTLMGKLSTRGGVQVARASYSRSADGATTQIDAYADSKVGQDIVVRDPSATPSFPITPLRAENGRYYAHVDVTGALPAKVEVVNRGDVPQTVKSVPVEDLVTGTATYDSTTNTLHVAGKTSDKSSSAGALSVPAFNKTFDATGAGDLTFVAPPDAVVVKSSKGGSMAIPVEVAQGTALPPLPLVANAGPDQTVELGTTVNLTGADSTGNITGYAWTAPAGVALTSTNAKTTSFVATAPGDFTITLAVSGIDGSPPAPATKLDTVVVHVNNVVAPVATIAPIGPNVPQNLPVTLDGTPSTGASTFAWTYVPGANDPAITLGSTTGSKLSFTFPKTLNTLTFNLRVCNAAATPVCATTTVKIAGQPDPLTIARARFNGGRWVVAGTAGSKLQNSVTVHAGSTLAGPVIGVAVVDALGNYQLDVRNSTVPGNTRISLESARGGVLLNQPVR